MATQMSIDNAGKKFFPTKMKAIPYLLYLMRSREPIYYAFLPLVVDFSSSVEYANSD
jgi:hypothetical protein